jgi:hypothetical protein
MLFDHTKPKLTEAIGMPEISESLEAKMNAVIENLEESCTSSMIYEAFYNSLTKEEAIFMLTNALVQTIRR